jgi:hypothetical protein
MHAHTHTYIHCRVTQPLIGMDFGFTQTYTQTLTHTDTHTHMHAHKHTPALTRTHIHTQWHTHTHTNHRRYLPKVGELDVATVIDKHVVGLRGGKEDVAEFRQRKAEAITVW